MRLVTTLAALATGICLSAGLCPGQTVSAEKYEQLQAQLTEAKAKVKVLERSIAAANRAEKEASEQLAKTREHLEAFGMSRLGGGDERLLEAVSDLQIQTERNSKLEAAAVKLAASITEYLGQAIASDPQSRLQVEISMRELDELLGLRQNPVPFAHEGAGTRNRATVMSIDSESGLLVLNAGQNQEVRIGNTYHLLRGDQDYATAIIADTRKNVSGAFVESMEAGVGTVRIGDIAILKIE